MKKFKTQKCRTKFCRGVTTEAGRSPYCGKCRSRRHAEKHPIKHAYGKLRSRAEERGHEFSLTFEDYTRLWHDSGYGANRGKTAKSLSIHRIDNDRGYHADNVTAITLSFNSRLHYANMPAWLRDEMKQACLKRFPEETLNGI